MYAALLLALLAAPAGGSDCATCHEEDSRRYDDGVHHAVNARGGGGAPACADCHGEHGADGAPPSIPRPRISETCASCHAEIGEAYAGSVHGRGLLEAGNPDVPACTDCHRAHDISSPRSEAWRLDSPAMCGKCHADEKRMAKYRLSTNVLRTYLADFHGVTASLRKAHPGSGEPITALCFDCHGVHDIARVKDPESHVMKANLVRTCQRCHPGAPADFPAAWLSHYDPSPRRTPVVWVVKAGYTVLIPLMIGGLVLQIGLQLRHALRRRL